MPTLLCRELSRSSFPLSVLLQFPEVRAAGLRGLVFREISQATSSLLSRFSKDSKPDSILDPRFSRESRIEDRVSILVSQNTVNLHLGGTVHPTYYRISDADSSKCDDKEGVININVKEAMSHCYSINLRDGLPR